MKCGKPLPPTTRRRNVAFEREVTEHAAHGAVDPKVLIRRSERRAASLSGEYVKDSMDVALGRDRLLDTREELEDARNHLVWWLEENPEHEKTHDALIALRFFALGYDRLLED